MWTSGAISMTTVVRMPTTLLINSKRILKTNRPTVTKMKTKIGRIGARLTKKKRKKQMLSSVQTPGKALTTSKLTSIGSKKCLNVSARLKIKETADRVGHSHHPVYSPIVSVFILMALSRNDYHPKRWLTATSKTFRA
jgi:hypothetical protein